MPTCQALFYPSSDGVHQIHARVWTPDSEPRGVVQISHGIREHIDRYDAFARFLAGRGFVVAGNDHLGHGGSFEDPEDQGFFAETGGWMRVVDDMHTLYGLIHGQYPRLPYFLMGHSMGSFLARTYIVRHQNHLRGVILSGTGMQSPAAVSFGIAYVDRLIKRNGPRYRSKRVTALCFGTYNNAFMPVRTLSDWLTRDEVLLDAHLLDTACDFTPTLSMYRDMFLGIRYMSARRNLRRMQKDLPIYLFSGDKDPVGESGKGVERSALAFMEAGCRDISVKLYADGRHEMLNEINRDQVYDDVLIWLESKL